MIDMQFPSDSHERLNILAGVWDTTITMLGTSGEAGETSKATDTYRWMPNGQFLVHDVDAIMGDQHVQSTEIFGVDPSTGTFVSHSYDPDGAINSFTSGIEGRAYTISGANQRFAGEFSQDGNTLTGEWKQLANGHWLPFVRIILNKRSGT